ncbi:type 1 glutamine amidotransferase [Dactylosporangium vinaceum]|uniref:Type 1 glutamine amidotransferase n=1 Tax=Dactylosporangium vinaceum TaxID=53362 RepID=A0ABV5MNK0_9ACTN|nr:type 1 glutamine amidotransferase [Dactylosporangium vinaceum]
MRLSCPASAPLDIVNGVTNGNLALVVENDPSDGPARLGDWLESGGLRLQIVRPHAGDPLPANLDGFAALVVLGGEQDAFPDAAGERAAPWFDELDGLLRKAVRYRIPTLAVCLGAQLLANAHGGTVERSAAGPEIGVKLVARRDVADQDPIFAAVPFAPDVFQWHVDEIVELPLNATLLAASTNYPVQAYRLGPNAWGLQFHIECDLPMFAQWAMDGVHTLGELGLDPIELLERAEAALDDIEEVWKPFAERFAAVALGRTPPAGEGGLRSLPLLGPR